MDFLNPEQVLNQLELRPEMMAADFGSGSGGWVLPLAKKLRLGRVYAIDIQPEVLDALKGKADVEKLTNVKTLVADLESGLGSSIQSGLLDLVVISNLLFQLENREKIFQEAAKVLRPNGQLLVVDWKPDAALGPQANRLGSPEARKMAETNGFKLEKEIEVGPYHWGLLFREV
jgi:ubiquinone/menaquinone biosynthesis C-methylase UbiE